VQEAGTYSTRNQIGNRSRKKHFSDIIRRFEQDFKTGNYSDTLLRRMKEGK
jgi:hypothetical protein